MIIRQGAVTGSANPSKKERADAELTPLPPGRVKSQMNERSAVCALVLRCYSELPYFATHLEVEALSRLQVNSESFSPCEASPAGKMYRNSRRVLRCAFAQCVRYALFGLLFFSERRITQVWFFFSREGARRKRRCACSPSVKTAYRSRHPRTWHKTSGVSQDRPSPQQNRKDPSELRIMTERFEKIACCDSMPPSQR